MTYAAVASSPARSSNPTPATSNTLNAPPLPFQSLLSLLSIWEKVLYRSCADGCTGGAASGRTAATGGGLGRTVAPLLGEGLVAGGRRALLGFR